MSNGLIKQLLEAVEVIVHREVAKAVSPDKWATVITASPLTVKQDGPADNPTIPATSLCGPLLAGARVFTQKMGRTIYVYGPPTPPTPIPDTGWIEITPASGYAVHEGQTPKYRIAGGVLRMQGAISKTSGTFGTAYEAITQPLPGWTDFSNHDWRTAAVLNSAGNRIPARGYVSLGAPQIMVAAVASTVHTAPTYVSLTGFSGIDLTD